MQIESRISFCFKNENKERKKNRKRKCFFFSLVFGAYVCYMYFSFLLPDWLKEKQILRDFQHYQRAYITIKLLAVWTSLLFNINMCINFLVSKLFIIHRFFLLHFCLFALRLLYTYRIVFIFTEFKDANTMNAILKYLNQNARLHF